MEKIEQSQEQEPKDISKEFSKMNTIEFLDFVDSLKNESSLSIIADWNGENQANRLKAFLEDSRRGQKRSAAIRATREQKYEAANAFNSGVKWIEVKTEEK